LGGGGGASYTSPGGNGLDGSTPIKPGPGGGGGGTISGTNATGGDGYVLVEWIG
jgi:hypothetical protein